MIVLIFFNFWESPKLSFLEKKSKDFFLQFSFIIGIVEWWRHINGVLPVFDRLLDTSLSYSDVIKYYDVIRAKSFFLLKNIDWIFFPQMTLSSFPKIHFLNFTWIFFHEWRFQVFPSFGFFFQNTRIRVNETDHVSTLPLKMT